MIQELVLHKLLRDLISVGWSPAQEETSEFALLALGSQGLRAY